MEERKLVALTFDDGPTIGITDQVLDVLEQNSIKASFFIIGEEVTEDNKYLMKRAHDMGCTIENHTWTHTSMPTQSEEEILDEIKRTTELIEEVVGEKPQYFRPPYIDYDQRMYDLIDLGFICGYGCFDWEPDKTAQMRVEMVLNDIKPGNIILMHDMHDNQASVDAIKVIIPELKNRGYEFVTIRDLFTLSGKSPEKNVIYMGVNEVRTNYN